MVFQKDGEQEQEDDEEKKKKKKKVKKGEKKANGDGSAMEVDGAEEKEGPLKTKSTLIWLLFRFIMWKVVLSHREICFIAESKERALKKKKNSEKNKEKMAVAREDDGFNTVWVAAIEN